ncbi:MAG TPA: MFS transporter [Trueperaceae bacterium]|nr:MFS transporter [Trueperaceae bacterium]
MRLSTRRAYYLVTSLNWFGAVLPMAVMVLLAQSRGLGLAEVGLFMGLYSIVVAVLELPSGALADKMGRKRAYILGGLLSALARGVFLLAFDLTAFMAFAVVLGASRALTSGALEAWFIDALQMEDPATDLQPELAAAGSYQLAALAIGTLLGGALPTLFSFLPSEGIVTPLAMPLVVSVGVQLLASGMAWLLIREERSAHDPGTARVGPSLRFDAVFSHAGSAVATVVKSPRLRLLLLVDVVIGAVLAGSENLWQPFFAALLPGDDVAAGGGTLALGVVLGGSFGVGILGNVVATQLSRAVGKRHALVSAIFQVAQGAAFVFLALSGRFLLATGLFWLTYLTRSGWSSPHSSLFHREVTPDRRTVMLSAQSLAGFAGAFVGSVALGALAEATSIGTAWIVAGAAVATCALPYLILDARARRGQGSEGAETPVPSPQDLARGAGNA